MEVSWVVPLLIEDDADQSKLKKFNFTHSFLHIHLLFRQPEKQGNCIQYTCVSMILKVYVTMVASLLDAVMGVHFMDTLYSMFGYIHGMALH